MTSDAQDAPTGAARAARDVVSAHLRAVLALAAESHPPIPDGTVEVMGRPAGPVHAVVAFSAHAIVAAGFVPVASEVLLFGGPPTTVDPHTTVHPHTTQLDRRRRSL